MPSFLGRVVPPPTSPGGEWEYLDGFKFQSGTLFDKKDLSWSIYVGDLVMNISEALAGIHHWDLSEYAHFAKDLATGNAKQYTFIEPNYGDMIAGTYKHGNSQHPLDDVRHGDKLIADVYHAIRSSPLWEDSLLIITWDEHGGFYDHVAPPKAPPPGDQPQMSGVNVNGFTFQQYGVRVPAVVVSPRVARNVIDHRLYDHSSIPATVEALFGLSPMTERDRLANNVTSLVTLSTPRTDCPTSLPNASANAPEFFSLAAAPADPSLMEPLDQGNLPGFVHAAMRRDIELSSPADRPAIVARVASLRTRADALGYLQEVDVKLKAARSVNQP